MFVKSTCKKSDWQLPYHLGMLSVAGKRRHRLQSLKQTEEFNVPFNNGSCHCWFRLKDIN